MTDAGGSLHGWSAPRCGRILCSLPAASRTGNSGCVSTACAGRSSPSVRNACPTSVSARHMPFPDMIPRIAGNGTSPTSFGKKAIGRYLRSGKERRYREDRWLKSFGLSRHDLARAVEDRRSHPFGRFILSGIRGDDQAATALHRSGISRLCALHADVDAFLPVMLKMCESGAMPQKDTGALSGTVPYPL